jgi:hypothetical protein
MKGMKLSVSLSEDEVATLDNYARGRIGVAVCGDPAGDPTPGRS